MHTNLAASTFIKCLSIISCRLLPSLVPPASQYQVLYMNRNPGHSKCVECKICAAQCIIDAVLFIGFISVNLVLEITPPRRCILFAP
jgi:ferredoxin